MDLITIKEALPLLADPEVRQPYVEVEKYIRRGWLKVYSPEGEPWRWNERLERPSRYVHSDKRLNRAEVVAQAPRIARYHKLMRAAARAYEACRIWDGVLEDSDVEEESRALVS